MSGRGQGKGPCLGLGGYGPCQFNPSREARGLVLVLLWSGRLFSLSRPVCVTGDGK